MKTKILVFLFLLFGGWTTTAEAIQTQWHLPVNEGMLPYNEDKNVVWEGYMNTTRYSAIDSCHYEGCPTAIGIKPTEQTIACPRDWKLGTNVEIDGKMYQCHDRYNKNLPDRLDIWTGWDKEAHTEALNYGNRQKYVRVFAS